MKESQPEVEECRLKTEAKNAGLMVAVFAIMLAVTASLAKVTKVIYPPEDKYKIAIKNELPNIDVRLIKQCVKNTVHTLPAPFAKTFYKDCE